ncbi:MAG: GYF domain-containing protein [Methylacidiphilales bacterium]|nr:GYF domain-containing protein [Candidatus Methylacidiphilales bacterium]
MPWYYAGPEAKPVGPVTLDELHACRVQGTVTPETYVIEHKGQPTETLTWKRYKDVFPVSSSLPPVPAVAPPPEVPQATPAPPVAQPHPLFPSAAPIATQQSVFSPTARPDPYYNVKPTNGWCGWGFGLGLAGFFLSFACVGIFPALLAFPICIVGLAQVHKHREQAGQGLAIAGLILSSVALLISLVFILSLAIPMIKAHEFTVTEQTSNDSESCGRQYF